MFRGVLYLAELAVAAIFVILIIKEVIIPLVKGTDLFPMFRPVKKSGGSDAE